MKYRAISTLLLIVVLGALYAFSSPEAGVFPSGLSAAFAHQPTPISDDDSAALKDLQLR